MAVGHNPDAGIFECRMVADFFNLADSAFVNNFAVYNSGISFSDYLNTIIHYFSTFVTKKLILTANVLNLYQGYQSPLPSAVITPIAPVRAATITEVNTCFVI